MLVGGGAGVGVRVAVAVGNSITARTSIVGIVIGPDEEPAVDGVIGVELDAAGHGILQTSDRATTSSATAVSR